MFLIQRYLWLTVLFFTGSVLALALGLWFLTEGEWWACLLLTLYGVLSGALGEFCRSRLSEGSLRKHAGSAGETAPPGEP